MSYASSSNGHPFTGDPKQAAERLAQTQRLTHTGTWEWRTDTDEVIWSDELFRIFGLDSRDFDASYAAFIQRVHPADRARVHEHIETSLESGRPFEIDHRVARGDGDVRIVHCNGEVVLADGRAVRAFGTCQDVTDRTRAEREIALARELALGIGAAATVEEALEMVLNRICEEAGFLLGQAWAQAAGASYLERCAAWPMDGGELEPFRRRSGSMTFERGEGLPGQAWASHAPVWIDDMKVANVPRATFARRAGVGAGLAVPVHAGGEVAVVLELFAGEAGTRDERLIRVVSTAAAQLGTHIERKRAEQELRKSEERFRLLVESVEDYAIVMLDRSGHVVSWNRGAERVTGYAEEEILGYHVSRFYPPEALDRGEPELHLEAAARDDHFEHTDWRVRRDGLRYRAHVTVTPLRNGVPEPRGFSYVIRDVTERLRIDEERRRLSAVIDSSQDAILSLTSERGVMTSANSGAERLFGHRVREIVGLPFARLLPEEKRGEHADMVSQVLAGNSIEPYETQAVRKNGGTVDVSLTMAPIRDADGEVSGLSVTARDISDRKLAHQSMEQALGTYLDRDVAEHILREGPSLKAREVDVTMMFVDIRGFTSYAERFAPREVVQTLNCLFDLAVPIITARGGHVDKFVGDGLLAVFGAPSPRDDHADCAVEAALEIARVAGERFQGDLEIGIGIDSGTVVAGNVGGGGRLDFTVIGDAVNTAARIEGATRATGDTILFSDQTRRRLWRTELLTEEREAVPIKGKREPVRLFVPVLAGPVGAGEEQAEEQ
ncbi:MAG: PAS domain S-box protein [Solirubrobacterales bacterium]